jgi:hypothetical protein
VWSDRAERVKLRNENTRLRERLAAIETQQTELMITRVTVEALRFQKQIERALLNALEDRRPSHRRLPMSFPDPVATIDLLGYRARDRITGVEGVVTCVTFDLYGCVQVMLHRGLDKDGKPHEQQWFDVGRLALLKDRPRVMEPPPIGTDLPLCYDKGPAEHRTT